MSKKGKGKQQAGRGSAKDPPDEPDLRAPVQCNPTNCQILVDHRGCMLAIKDVQVPRAAEMYEATVDGKRCVALRKTMDGAYTMYKALLEFTHPNILKPVGIWEDPHCHDVAYIVFRGVDGTMAQLGGQTMFEEGNPYNGFSEHGFKMFRAIFSTIDHVNSHYAGEGTSSARNTQLELIMKIRLDQANIYYKMVDGEPLVLLGNMDIYYQGANGLKATHWNEIGVCLNSLFGSGNQASMELRELARFLMQGTVSYDDLLWQPGLWNANTKMEFIREIHFMVDMDRDANNKLPYAQTKKGCQLAKKKSLGLFDLMQEFTKPKDENNIPRERKEDHLLDSVLFLRNKIVAHYDDEYKAFSGQKEKIGTTKAQIERYVQHSKGDYMIKLARAIKELGWFDSSPLLRGDVVHRTRCRTPKRRRPGK
uniref:Uncharacterized protein n=1 Tax=Aegilops tauschii TaxID=37682 RepID=M8BZP7_AEGTA